MIEKLPILVIHAHTRCNARCVMCDIWKTSEGREFSLAQLRAQKDAMKRLGVEWVVFTGGEPLMHSDLFSLTRELRADGLRVTVLSTGLLLARFAADIVRDVDDVIVSLDGPQPVHDAIRRVRGAFAAVEAGVAAVHDLAPEFAIAARCTVQKMNHAHLAATASAAKGMGLASISYLAADLSSDAFGREAAPTADLALDRKQIEELEKELATLTGDPFVADSPRHLERIAAHFKALAGNAPFAAPRCNAPWVSAVMEADGRVRPCFFHPVVGTANGVPLDAVLNGPQARTFREGLDISANPVCRRCVCSLYRAPG